MKILHTADWHIGNFPGPEKDGKNLRALDTENCIHNLWATAKQENPDIIVISGDLFHQSRVWADRGLSEVETAIREIEALSRIAPVVVMRGTPNHDGEEQFKLLEAHFMRADSRTLIVIKPTVATIDTAHGPIQVACLPGFDRGVYRSKFPGLSKEEENVVFTQELGNVVMGLKAQCKDEIPQILLAHYTVPGCNTESGQTPFLAQFEPVITPETLDAAQFDLVCLGHIHRPQMLESCRNVYYSGALNAMNFNDEGQGRGFWIHELNETLPHAGSRSRKGHFYNTPAREFKTIRLDNDDIAAYNTSGYFGILSKVDDITDKIVRVIYSCTEEENKALNRAALETDLKNTGNAFWVSEIVPDNITAGTSKHELSEKTDPEANLIEYLKERAVDDKDIPAIVELARPIIAEVLASGRSARLTGMFVPIEISVKNYRNYAEETFSFKDITYCTINGKNGAGKSSLFMDAILDALYEEPREGELTAWIRADEKARSGSISFTFAIGDATFRVVRTRAKSGKATLNLSELVDGEWENRSRERYRDTQEEIINILGMDSLTFRSCALIMQDQYGLFLQADKEARMSILGNILGLGIYGDMEQKSRERLSELNRSIAFSKKEIVNLDAGIKHRGNPQQDIDTKQLAIQAQEDLIKLQNKERDELNISLNSQLERADKAAELLDNINTLKEKKQAIAVKLSAQKAMQTNAQREIDSEELINEKVAELISMEGRLSELTAKKAVYDKTVDAYTTLKSEIESAEQAIQTKDALIRSELKKRFQLSEKHMLVSGYSVQAEEYQAVSNQISSLRELDAVRQDLSARLIHVQGDFKERHTRFTLGKSAKETQIKELEKKTELLQSCNCVDIGNANCRFLADSKESAAKIGTYRAEYQAWIKVEEAELAVISDKRTDIERSLLGYEHVPGKIKELMDLLHELEPMKREYDTLDLIAEQRKQCHARCVELANEMEDLKHAQKERQARLDQAESELASYENFDAEYKRMTSEIAVLNIWRDKQRMLPLHRERMITATERIAELESEISSIDTQIEQFTKEREELMKQIVDAGELKQKLAMINSQIELGQHCIGQLRTKIGALEKELKDIEHDKAEIRTLQDKVNHESVTAAHYEILKHAFSQDGIPHNIIRTIVPILTATSNSILGQMTGGKMGMQFVTDKIQKSNKKEVVTLDIVIEEYGKDTLPYLSKSGGEKVKSSLSAILALAEIKSTQAGIQLGMLFIDEPPFLDDDGTQAYCDALETIQHRYSDVKIMAITHDPTFKARFPQSLDVIKTDAGSKVVFE